MVYVFCAFVFDLIHLIHDLNFLDQSDVFAIVGIHDQDTLMVMTCEICSLHNVVNFDGESFGKMDDDDKILSVNGNM